VLARKSGETAPVVEALIERLDEGYVLSERAAEAASLLRARLAEGSYDLPLGPEFCRRASGDLLDATGDKHLRLLWHEAPQTSGRGEEQFAADLLEQFKLENQGVRRVERLEGNVGVIALSIIPPAALAGASIVAVMRLVQDTHALILDLRETRGGSPDGVALLASFLFPDGDVHLNDVVQGAQGPRRQYWTSAYVPGPRYLDRPVYVLTSSTTFSGGEELAYDLQVLGRAIVIGEVTRGGAQPSAVVSLSEQVELRLPVARTVNPVTGGNWEGAGVQPDIPATAADALEVARQAALRRISDDPALPAASCSEARDAMSRASETAAMSSILFAGLS
jgi:C-terminal processing protease CtpA/Prc